MPQVFSAASAYLIDFVIYLLSNISTICNSSIYGPRRCGWLTAAHTAQCALVCVCVCVRVRGGVCVSICFDFGSAMYTAQHTWLALTAMSPMPPGHPSACHQSGLDGKRTAGGITKAGQGTWRVACGGGSGGECAPGALSPTPATTSCGSKLNGFGVCWTVSAIVWGRCVCVRLSGFGVTGPFGSTAAGVEGVLGVGIGTGIGVDVCARVCARGGGAGSPRWPARFDDDEACTHGYMGPMSNKR